MPPSHSEKISERAQHLLKALVKRYIRDGQPVGSRTLSRDANLDLSAATIRNVMADLEEMGLVRSPHASAGRIPTTRGYRLFIDTLLQVKPLDKKEESLLRDQFHQAQDDERLWEHVSHFLAGVTHFASVVMLPQHDSKALRHVEFLPLSKNRVLAILVINEHEVQNRIIHTSRRYSATELEQAAHYLNAAFVGKDITKVRANLLQELQETRQNMNKMMQALIEVAEKAFVTDTPERNLVMTGQTNLMNVADLSNVDKLRELFAAFNQKRDILQLFDQAINAQGVQIFIGEESGYKVFDGCSVITSPYHTADGELVGVLGVIGPTRMPYDRVIPIVDVTAKLISSILEKE
jgi:heat-inducible transcriptional repressor